MEIFWRKALTYTTNMIVICFVLSAFYLRAFVLDAAHVLVLAPKRSQELLDTSHALLNIANGNLLA